MVNVVPVFKKGTSNVLKIIAVYPCYQFEVRCLKELSTRWAIKNATKIQKRKLKKAPTLLKPHFVYWFHGSCFINHKTFVSFLWIKIFKWYVLGSWTFLTYKKRRQNHSYPFCNFSKFHEVLFHFLHEFFLTQCKAMASYLISPLHCIHNG